VVYPGTAPDYNLSVATRGNSTSCIVGWQPATQTPYVLHTASGPSWPGWMWEWAGGYQPLRNAHPSACLQGPGFCLVNSSDFDVEQLLICCVDACNRGWMDGAYNSSCYFTKRLNVISGWRSPTRETQARSRLAAAECCYSLAGTI